MSVSSKPEFEILSIRTFGGLTAWLGVAREPLHFETRTVEALLVYLACQGRRLGRDALAELFWPERTQEQARANLSVGIHRLRRQLDPYLLVTRQDVSLNPTARIDLDVTQFESCLAAGRLAAATALYTGDFLDGFYLRSNPAFEQWALLERERLRTLALAAWQQLIGQMAVDGQLDAAIAGAQCLLQLDPLHEPSHRQLMRLLAQVDQRSAALAQYEICRQLLISELEVAPDEMTMALYEQIRLGEIEAVTTLPSYATIPSPTQPVTLLSPHNLPLQPTPFIGRGAEVAQIEKSLANPDCRLLTLLGVGGIGKTRLAIETASRQSGNFAEGVCFVSLASVGVAELAPLAIAQSLGVQITSSDPQAEIAAYLRPRQLLLVLDNFEHLPEAAGTVAHLLQHAPRLKMLVTSRERLYLREEWLLPIAGLSHAEGLAGEAGELFQRTAERVQPAFTGRGQEEAIATICRQVEGMPLALELAASWVRVMSCVDIAHQIQENFDFLSTGLRNLPARHRSLRALFDQSWSLLAPLEQGVLMRLSIFAGGWTLDEAAAVTGATLALLLGLVDKSLVRASAPSRFDLHELVRQYAAEQLLANGEDDLIRQRHYTTYLQLFQRGDSHLRGAEMATWMARLEAEQDNLRAALQWTLDEARYADTAWLLLAGNYFWYLNGHNYETVRWIARLLPHRQALTVEVRLAIFIDFIGYGGDSEEFPSCDEYRAEIIELMELCPYQELHAHALGVLAWSEPDFAQNAAARARSLRLVRAANEAPELGPEFCHHSDHEYHLAATQWVYAYFLLDQGEIAQATSLVTDSLQRFRKRGNKAWVGDCLGTLGLLALLQGDIAEAHFRFQEVVTNAITYNLTLARAEWQSLLGLVTLYSGNAREARRLLEESLHICLAVKSTSFLARVCLCLAEAELWEGEIDQAAHWLAQSLGYDVGAAPQRITIDELQRLFVAARLATMQEQYRRAATLLGVAEAAHRRIHYVYAGPMLPLVNAALSKVREALGVEVFDEVFAAGQQLFLNEAYTTLLAPAHSRNIATLPTPT